MRSPRPVHRLSLLATSAFLALGSASCDAPDADAPRETTIMRSVTRAIEGGSVDRIDTSVMGLSIQIGFSGALCSGTLIAPNLILTARHCIADLASETVDCRTDTFGAVTAGDNVNATTAVQVSFGGRGGYQSTQIEVPPDDDNVCGYDIAVVILDENVPATVTEPWVPRVDVPVESGEIYTAAGYGQQADGTGAGTRRVIGDREVVCVGRECGFSNGVVNGEFVGTGGVCSGDSGGPAFDELGRVIGVASRGGAGCSDSIYSEVPHWGDWLREMGALAADMGGYDAPLWVTAGITDPAALDADVDGVLDTDDNCAQAPNADQTDHDGDLIGDVCDPDFVADRGGDCSICNACTVDADCGAGGVCVDFGRGGWCAADCAGGAACPGDARCASFRFGEDIRPLCLNPGIAAASDICRADYVCTTPGGTDPEGTGSEGTGSEGTGDGTGTDGTGDGAGGEGSGVTPTFEDEIEVTSSADGCAAADPAQVWSPLGLALAGLASLRRRRARR